MSDSHKSLKLRKKRKVMRPRYLTWASNYSPTYDNDPDQNDCDLSVRKSSLQSIQCASTHSSIVIGIALTPSSHRYTLCQADHLGRSRCTLVGKKKGRLSSMLFITQRQQPEPLHLLPTRRYDQLNRLHRQPPLPNRISSSHTHSPHRQTRSDQNPLIRQTVESKGRHGHPTGRGYIARQI